MDSGNSYEGDEASLDSQTSHAKKKTRPLKKIVRPSLITVDPRDFRRIVHHYTGAKTESPLSSSPADVKSISHYEQSLDFKDPRSKDYLTSPSSPTAPSTATDIISIGPTSIAATIQNSSTSLFEFQKLKGKARGYVERSNKKIKTPPLQPPASTLIPLEFPAAAPCEVAPIQVVCDQVATPERMEEFEWGSRVSEQHEARLFQGAEASGKSSIAFKKPSLGKEKETTQFTIDEQRTENKTEMMMNESESDEEMINEWESNEEFIKLMSNLDGENNFEVEDDLLFCVERDTNARPVQAVLTEMPKGEECHAQVVRTTDLSKCLVLPGSPNCTYLVTLSLEGSKSLIDIPSSFFDRMPILKHLNLSQTSIRSLPVSLFKLVSLKELIIRHCKLFFKLSPEVGRLHSLEVLDLDGTEIVDLPKEIKSLCDLKVLRLSLHGCMNSGNQMHQTVLIYPETIRSLSQLVELSIGVNPDDESWNAVVEAVVEEACSLERLTSLELYLPNIEIWEKCRRRSKSLNHNPLSKFRFTVGPPHKRRIISRVPEKVETHFQRWDKWLKFIKGNAISSEMKSVVRNTKAFYLDRHPSARSLCDFGIENIQNLKFCLVTECNEIVSIIDGGDSSLKMVEDDESNNKYISGSYSYTLGNLQYLHIHYLKNLVSIWRTPSNAMVYLFGLKILSLHICPKLSDVFSPVLAQSLCSLEELIIEDCPEVTCVVSNFSCPTSLTSNENSLTFLPKLKKMILLFLPKLVSISSGLQIAPELEKIGLYDCPELKSLSAREIVSSDNLKVIKGESEWWDSLELDESEWGNRLNHLRSIFSPVDEYGHLSEMEEM